MGISKGVRKAVGSAVLHAAAGNQGAIARKVTGNSAIRQVNPASAFHSRLEPGLPRKGPAMKARPAGMPHGTTYHSISRARGTAPTPVKVGIAKAQIKAHSGNASIRRAAKMVQTKGAYKAQRVGKRIG